jgi:hypothetical protein
MDVSQTSAAAPVLARDLAYAARNYLSGRRGLLILAAAVVAVGAALNWSWLAAAGIAPLLLSLLPCAAMCALGLCMSRMSWSRSPQNGAPDAKALPNPAPPINQSLTNE